jgi:hypothetical protein
VKRLIPLLAIAMVLLLAAACGGDDDDDPTATPEPSPSATGDAGTPTELPTATATPTEDPLPGFQGSRITLKNDTHEPEAIPVLADVRVGTHEGYDRIAFEFDGEEFPPWEVKYVAEPVACASGKDVLVGGTAALQVNLFIAQAHDEQGQLTIPSIDIAAAYPAIVQALSTCDFEALVTWIVGTEGDLRFRAFELTDPARLVVDIEHPAD